MAVIALFFIGDVIGDFVIYGELAEPHLWLKAAAAVALIGGVAFLMVELHRLLSRIAALDTSLRAARPEP